LHWRGPHHLVDTIEAFQQLQEEGKILSWGISNFDVPDLKEAAEWPVGTARYAIRFFTICKSVLWSITSSPGVKSTIALWLPTVRLVTEIFPPRTHPEAAF
jgi:hypothetical protein